MPRLVDPGYIRVRNVGDFASVEISVHIIDHPAQRGIVRDRLAFFNDCADDGGIHHPEGIFVFVLVLYALHLVFQPVAVDHHQAVA